jgi:acetylornithine deacetylase/succinyl-diaminopimelate desuccinylase-like protein
MTPGVADPLDRAVEERMDEHLRELARLCAVPSISAEGSRMEECAELVADALARRGAEVELLRTGGYPVVFGQLGSGERRLLLYNHYDVQPAGDRSQWETPPFEAYIGRTRFVARGAVDDKGHIVSRLAALDAYRTVCGELPFRLLFLVEGEEEIGSTHLPDVIESNAERLRADGCIWESGGVDLAGRPIASLGVRGIVELELRVRTASHDVHSGEESYLPNAAWRLVWALNTLKRRDEEITVPGFLKGAVEPTDRQRELIAALPPIEEEARAQFEIAEFAGARRGRELNEAMLAPTCTISGLTAGYQGTGTMPIIPSVATAKLDLRLLPGQDPDAVVARVRERLDAQGFGDVELAAYGATAGAFTDPDDPFVALCSECMRSVYGMPPLLTPWAGGSGPMALFVGSLGAPVMDIGIAYPGCRAHGPNEHFRVNDWLNGTKAMARLLSAFATERPEAPGQDSSQP